MTEITINDKCVVSESVEQKWKLLTEEGVKSLGITPDTNPEVAPKWFDRNKFEKAQKLNCEYLMSMIFGAFTGSFFVLQIFESFAPLVTTGNSTTVAKLFRRYLSTVLHQKSWYENDPFDPKSTAFKSLKTVRHLHKTVSDSMNKKSGKVVGSDRLWISQFDMVNAQFAFTGFVALHPKECGLHSLSHEEFDSLLYFWRVIGHCLGIEDRFNLCSGTTEEVVQLCQVVYTRKWYPLIKGEPTAFPPGEEMARGICLAMQELGKFNHWNVYLKYWFPIININKTVELQSFTEKFWYHLMAFSMAFATKLWIFRYVMNKWVRLNIWMAVKYKASKYESLKNKYKDMTFDNKSCPLNVNFDYTDFETMKK